MENICENMRNNIKKYVLNTKSDWNYITPQKYHDDYYIKKSRHILIDLRKKEDFNKFHIKGAINIFWMDLLKSNILDTLLTINIKTPIFLICYVGHTSSQTMTLLKLSGITNVTSIKYGMGKSPINGVPIAGWLQYGYPIEGCVK